MYLFFGILLVFYYFVVTYLLFTAIRFLNKNSNKTIKYFIQKIGITPKRLEISIHNVNKSGLKIKFYIHI
jgi:hypothetical protein